MNRHFTYAIYHTAAYCGIKSKCLAWHLDCRVKPTSDDLFLSSALLEGSVMNRSVILVGLECFGEVLNIAILS